MRTVQLAQQFGQHLLEVVVVVDVRQVTFVGLAIAFPVDAMQVGVIELVLHLAPGVVEDVGTLLGRAVAEVGGKAYPRHLALAHGDFLDGSAGEQVDVLAVLVDGHAAATHVLDEQLGGVLAEIALPQVISTLESRTIVQLVAFGRQYGVAHVRGVDGEPPDAVLAVLQVEDEGFHLFLLLLVLVGFLLVFLLVLFLFLSLFLRFLLLFLGLFRQRQLLFREVELVVGLGVKEHDVHVVLRTPAAMAAIAGTVGRPDHGLASQHPLGVAVGVSAFGQVGHLTAAVGFYQHDVGVVPSAHTDILGQEPATVGRPLVGLVAVGVRIVVLAVEHRPHLARLQVDDAQRGTVFEESHFLAVGREGGLEGRASRNHQRLFLHTDGVGEELLFLVGEARQIDTPHTVAFGRINQRTAVGAETQVALLLGRVGDAAGGFILHRGDVDVAMHNESHLLAAGRHGNVCRTAAQQLIHHVALQAVGHDGYGHLLRFSTFAQGVELAVVGVAQQAVVGHAERAHRMGSVARQLAFFRTVGRRFPHVETAALLAQVVEGTAVGRPHGFAVFAGKAGYLLIGALPVEGAQPDVFRNGRLVMLSPGILISLLVLIEQAAAVTAERKFLHGQRREEHGASALGVHRIDLREEGRGELTVLHVGTDGGSKEYCLIVLEGLGIFVARVGGEASGRSSLTSHQIDVEAAFAVGGKGDVATVRRPHGTRVVTGVRRQLHRPSAFDRHSIDVTFVGESYLPSVGRQGGITQPQGRVVCLGPQGATGKKG